MNRATVASKLARFCRTDRQPIDKYEIVGIVCAIIIITSLAFVWTPA